jgi:acetoacetate decarboxylase
VGFVKTAAEIERIEAAIGAPRFGGAQMLSVEFLVDPEFAATILPPPLEPVAEPRMRAMVGRWQSNCVGDFAGGTVYVTCAHEALEGEYNVAQYMDGDASTIFGRDVFGEPKKMASATLRARGDSMRGEIARHGVALITLEAELGPDNGPVEATRESYNIKIPIGEVLRATYFEGDLSATVESVARIPAATFAPFHHGRNDDWSALATADQPPVLMGRKLDI